MSKALSIIAAVASNNAIGKNNDLLWHISDDLKRFKKLTSGHTIVMGRKTFESFPNGPLPNRHHVILSSNANYSAPGCDVCTTVNEVLSKCQANEENFILGGGTVYKMLLPYCNKMYLTLVYKDFEADTFFPEYNNDEWKKEYVSGKIKEEKSGLIYEFVNFIRK